MKVEYINPFIEASINVISETTRLTPILGKVYVGNNSYKGDNVLVVIGITGAIQGNVVISLQTFLACKICSAMMMGMPVSEFDDIAKSAIAELGNMILGNAANIFYKNNINIDITPPTVLTGDNLQLSQGKTGMVCVPLKFKDEEHIDINVYLKDS